MWKLLSMVSPVVAFFIGAIGWDRLVKREPMELFVGLLLGLGVFIFCSVKDNEELQQLCSPPMETWPVPLPIAWGCVKEVLESASVVTGTGGSSGLADAARG